jgi:hypothetical protein
VIGTYDTAADRFDLLLTGQGVHSLRQQLAGVVFNMPADRITASESASITKAHSASSNIWRIFAARPAKLKGFTISWTPGSSRP